MPPGTCYNFLLVSPLRWQLLGDAAAGLHPPAATSTGPALRMLLLLLFPCNRRDAALSWHLCGQMAGWTPADARRKLSHDYLLEIMLPYAESHEKKVNSLNLNLEIQQLTFRLQFNFHSSIEMSHYNLLNQSSTFGHLGCFQLFTIINNSKIMRVATVPSRDAILIPFPCVTKAREPGNTNWL